MASPDPSPALSLPVLPAAASTRGRDGLALSDADFQPFYQRTARPLKSYLNRLTNDPALADDLLQEAYYRLLRADLPPLDDNGLKNYLYRIATNLARDHFRGAKFRGGPIQEDRAGSDPRPAAQLSADVQRVLNEIKPAERELVWLAYVEGSSHREIATVTGLKETSIRPLLYRVRQKLASLLRERGLAAHA